MQSNSAPSATRRSRSAKACENCRDRRTKCEPPYPCRACKAAGLKDCQVRERARPSRQIRIGDSSATIHATDHEERVTCTARIERELEQVYFGLTGQNIHLGSVEGHTHPALDLSSPLPPLPGLAARDKTALEIFITACLPMCSVLTPSRARDLFSRFASTASNLSPDQTALVYMMLACGYARLHYFGEHGRNARHAPERTREDVAWYRHAVAALSRWGSASYTSLHALCVMWFYTTTVSTTQSSRAVTAWMITQAKELGLHQKSALGTAPTSPLDRADYVAFLILYAHSYSVGLTGLIPLLNKEELDNIVYRTPSSADIEERDTVYPRPAVLDLTLMTNRLLMDLHDQAVPSLPLHWLLETERHWDAWLRSWSLTDQPSAHNRIDPFAGILWNWGRMLLRTIVMNDERFAMSSLAILSRSASQILSRYHEWYSSQVYNLSWQHLHHITTCANVTLFCYWRHELLKQEAEVNLNSAIWILQLAQPRWTTFAQTSRERIERVCEAFGLSVVVQPAMEPAVDLPTTFGGAGHEMFGGFDMPEIPEALASSSFDFLFLDNAAWLGPPR